MASVLQLEQAEKLGKAIERLNKLGCPIEAEWGDEWTSCDECGRYVRTSPDSYGWTRSYADINSATCLPRVRQRKPRRVYRVAHEPPQACQHHLGQERIEAAGFRPFADGLENGLHEFQAASPTKIAHWLRERGVNEYLFTIDDVGQFDTTFSVWIRGEDAT